MRERIIEQRLVKAVENHGGRAIKITSPSFAGMPDRLILLPRGKSGFVELKSTGLTPRPLQQHRIEQLRELGYRCYVIDHPNQIEEVIREIRSA